MTTTARFILQGDNRTDAAFRAVDRNLTKLHQTMGNVRRIAGLFGVSFGVHMFAGWIKSGIEAGKVSQNTLQSLNALKGASTALAGSFANTLAPAAGLVASALHVVNRDLFGVMSTMGDLNKEINQLTHRAAGLRNFGAHSQASAIEEQVRELERRRDAMMSLNRANYFALLGSAPLPRGTFARQAEAGGLGEISVTARPRPATLPTLADINAMWQPSRLAKSMGPPASLFVPNPSEVAAELEPVKNEFERFNLAIGRGLHDSFVDALTGVEVNFKDTLKRMAAELFASAVFSGLGALFGGPATFLGGLFGGARAEGGPVSGGRAYLVGERGPELFVPGASGAIAANGGGGVSITYNIDARGSVGAEVLSKLPAQLKATEDRTMAHIRDLRNRRRF